MNAYEKIRASVRGGLEPAKLRFLNRLREVEVRSRAAQERIRNHGFVTWTARVAVPHELRCAGPEEGEIEITAGQLEQGSTMRIGGP